MLAELPLNLRLAWVPPEPGTVTVSPFQRISGEIGTATLTQLCRRRLANEATVYVSGLEHFPADGPVVLAARHVHHALDGCVFFTELPRPFRAVVTSDWAPAGLKRNFLAWGTRSMGWPTLLRQVDGVSPQQQAAAVKRALSDAVSVLQRGEVLLIFPEGYPNIDPHPTPKTSLDAFLPFEPGFAKMVSMAQRATGSQIPVVPVGFWYAGGPPWTIYGRFGAPVFFSDGKGVREFANLVEARVRSLSQPPQE